MSDVGHNKELIRQWFTLMNENRIDEAFDLVADDAIFWLAGNLLGTGLHSKAERLANARAGAQTFSTPPQFQIKSMTAEENRVVVEAEVHNTYQNDSRYEQQYVFVFEVDGAKIQAERTYLDTDLMRRVAAVALWGNDTTLWPKS